MQHISHKLSNIKNALNPGKYLSKFKIFQKVMVSTKSHQSFQNEILSKVILNNLILMPSQKR